MSSRPTFPPSKANLLNLWSGIVTLIVLLTVAGCEKRATEEQQSNLSAVPSLAYGTKVSFARSGNAGPIKVSGWNEPEEKFTWSDGTSSVVRVRVEPSEGPVTMKMSLAGMVKEPDLPLQTVEVSVNQKQIAEWQVANTATFSAPLPPELTKKGGTLTFSIKVPKAVSPKQLGVSADPRVLGICVFDFELSKG